MVTSPPTPRPRTAPPAPRLVVPLVVAFIVPLVAGCTAPHDARPTAVITEDFEDGLAGWTVGADVPDDPNRPGNQVRWSIGATGDRARSGQTAVNLSIDGRQDDGTIWVVHGVAVEPGQRYRANVTAYAWSAGESFNTIANLVMLLSTEPPSNESSFPSTGEDEPRYEDAPLGRGLREPLNLAEGWRAYSFEWTTPALDTDTLHVAVGITVVWETWMVYYVDDVQVTLEPLG